MKVILRRDLFLGGIKYEADPAGTEIPDVIDGRKVVLSDPEYRPDEKTLRLPADTVIFNEENTHKAPPLSASQRVRPMTLAEGAALVEGNDGSLHSFTKNDPALAATREAAMSSASLLDAPVKNAGTTKNDGKK